MPAPPPTRPARSASRWRAAWRTRGSWSPCLLQDPDLLVRAAALAALGSTACPAPYDATAVIALADASWQVRAGAATALGAADPEFAVPALAKALGDANADVRAQAVLALLRHSDREDARAALTTAVTDPDADVRAYAARAAATTAG